MPGRLVVRGGERAGTVYVLDAEACTLGRDLSNAVVLAGHHVSRRHAEILVQGDVYQLRDLGSKNGICLNGQRVGEPRPLADGDVITIPGIADLTLVFESNEETVTAHAAEAAPGVIVIDPRTAELRVRGAPVRLTQKEYVGLSLLYEKGGALVTKEELAARVWPEFDGAVSDDSIEQIVYRLRRKLEENPAQPRHLLTMRGLGYRLVTA